MDILREKKLGKYSLIWCACAIVLSVSLLTSKLKPGPATQVIATGYLVPKTGNAAITTH